MANAKSTALLNALYAHPLLPMILVKYVVLIESEINLTNNVYSIYLLLFLLLLLI